VTPEQLAKELAEGQIRPAYLLAGSEALLRDDVLDVLRTRILDGAADDWFAQSASDQPSSTGARDRNGREDPPLPRESTRARAERGWAAFIAG